MSAKILSVALLTKKLPSPTSLALSLHGRVNEGRSRIHAAPHEYTSSPNVRVSVRNEPLPRPLCGRPLTNGTNCFISGARFYG